LLEASVSISDLLAASVSISDLLLAGVGVADLVAANADIKKLLAAGITLSQLLAANATISKLLAGNVTVVELLAEQVTVAQLIATDAPIKDLLAAGKTVSELLAANATISKLLDAGVTVVELLVEQATVAQLLAANVTVVQLLAAGVTVTQLLAANVTVVRLLAANVSVAQLLTEQVTVAQLLIANVSHSNIILGLLTNQTTISNIYTTAAANNISKDTVLTRLLLSHVNLVSILTNGGYSTSLLLQKYSRDDLLTFGYSNAELVAAGIPVVDPSCFNTGTTISCVLDNGEDINIKVEDLKVGMNVKSYLHGIRKIKILCMGSFKNDPLEIRSCMYKMKETGLMITGGHAILVDKLTPSEEKETIEKWDLKYIDDKVLLMCAYSDKFNQQLDDQEYTYYHFCLENDGDELVRYGVYADGVLVETPSEKYIKTFRKVVYL
jgi:hypothetical protein